MHGFLRNPLATVATLAVVGLGGLTVTARPAAALSNDGRNALGVIVGLGATALILDGLTRDDRPRGQRPAPPPPRMRDPGPGWGGPGWRDAERRGPDRWDRHPEPGPRWQQGPRRPGRDRW